MPSRSGELPLVSCRSRSPQRTSRRGSRTPPSWRWTTRSSASPCPAGSPRTGWRAATGRSSARRWPGSWATRVTLEFEVREVAAVRAGGQRGRAGGGRCHGRPDAGGDRQGLAAGAAGGRPGRRARGWLGQPQPPLHLPHVHRGLGQPPRTRREPVGRRAPRPRLQPIVPVRRRRPRQDPPDARHRQRRRRTLPAQAGRLRHEREVHQRVHHLRPAGSLRRLPGPLPAHRPAAHR